jgi:peptidyl-prolyl cis-trans isomerase D
MLDVLRRGQRWLIWFVVLGIGGVFVFFLGLQGPLQMASGGTVVAVGPYQFGTREFERARARRTADLRERLGEQIDERELADTIDQLVARELVDRALLAMEAEALGLSVTKQEIESFVKADPGFRDESGRFDQKLFEDFADYEYGSQTAFIQEQRLQLLALKLVRVLNSQPRVSEGEVREAVGAQLETVQIAFVALGDEEVDPAAVAAEEVAKAVETRAEELRAAYDARSDEFNKGESIRARHILFSLSSGAPESEEQAALQKARTVLERLKAGEAFAALAGELSEDQGSREAGGDLGFFERGQMVPPFEEAAFALEPGAVSEPVRTPFGIHVIKVEEHRTALHRPFEEVREELARDLLAREVAQRKGAEQAEALSAAVRGGKSLEQAAREMGLTLERSGALTRRPDGYIPGLGSIPEMLATAFALQPGQSSPRVFELDEMRALVQVLDRQPPDPKLLEERLATTRQQILDLKRNQRAEAWVNARREELVSAGALSVNLGGR